MCGAEGHIPGYADWEENYTNSVDMYLASQDLANLKYMLKVAKKNDRKEYYSTTISTGIYAGRIEYKIKERKKIEKKVNKK